MTKSTIYYGTTTHARRSPRRNRFTYPIYMACIDLDDLISSQLDAWPVFSSRSPYAITSCLQRDHMIHEDMSKDLKTRVCDFIQRHNEPRPTGRICLLTNLRILGVEFNPVSFYYIFNAIVPHQIDCIVAEVANFPWFEQHPYLTKPLQQQQSDLVHSVMIPFSTVEKQFHVSPFMPANGLYYTWQFSTIQQHHMRIRISLNEISSKKPVFYASMDAKQTKWTCWNLLKMQIMYPWHTILVMGGILYEASKLFRKGFTFFPHPTGATSTLSRCVERVVNVAVSINNFFSSWRGGINGTQRVQTT